MSDVLAGSNTALRAFYAATSRLCFGGVACRGLRWYPKAMVRRDGIRAVSAKAGTVAISSCAFPVGVSTGNATARFNQLDSYVWRRMKTLRVKRKGRHLQAGEAARWSREYFEHLGLYRLRGTVRYPAQPFWKQESA